MALIVLNLPKKRIKNIEIIRSEKLLIEERKKQEEIERKLNEEETLWRKKMEELQRMRELEEMRRREEERQEMLRRRPIFTEEYTISNNNQPLQISLSDVLELSLPIEEMRKEIQNAYDKGFQDGCQTTQAAMNAEIMKYHEWLRNIDTVIIDLRTQFSKALADLEESAPDLAVLSAEHILGHELSVNSNIVIEQTRRAIAALDSDEIFKIRLNPNTVESLVAAKSKLVSDSTRLEKVVFAADESIEPGGCILETSAGIIDARISTQLESIRQSLKEVIKQPAVKEEVISEIGAMDNEIGGN